MFVSCFVGPKRNRVKYISTKPHAGGFYTDPNLDVFKKGETRAWRFDNNNGTETVIAGPGVDTCNYA